MYHSRLQRPRPQIMWLIFLCAILWAAAPVLSQEPREAQAPQAEPAPREKRKAPPRPTILKVAAGDLDGDGRDEALTWDSDTRELVVWSYAGGERKKLTSTVLQNAPTKIELADLDGDGKEELLIGEGLRGYNSKDGPQTSLRLRVYRPLGPAAWQPEELHSQASERPEFTAIQVLDLDGDKKPEILFACFVSKYQVEIRTARRQTTGWTTEALPQIRMGTSVSAGQLQRKKATELVVGRPYGEQQGAIGDAFILRGGQRVALPVFRGVSSVTAGHLRKNKEPVIVVGDGWHQDYGKIARGRVALLRPNKTGWDYELIEDVPEQMRIVELHLLDLDGDGTSEILARGEQSGILGGDLRLYQRTSSGWRGTTLAQDVQGFALGRFRGPWPEILYTGAPEPKPLNLGEIAWDKQLAPEVKTLDVDAKALVGKPAPLIEAAEWMGGKPLNVEQLKGKVVLLDFWATWCGPCIKQFPKMREWSEKLASQGLVIVGMTDYSRQTRAEIEAFLSRQKLPWPVGIDPSRRTSMLYGVGPIPHSVVIDRHGVVRLVHVGAAKLEEIEQEITTLLQAKAE